MIVIARQGDTVDALCWRELGVTRGMVETVYAMNRGLAALGPILPLGTIVRLPERPRVAAPLLPTVQLWD